MKRLIAFAAVLYPLLAGAQNLVTYDVSDLADSDAPRIAVFTEDYYYSQEWFDLDQRIDRYISAHAFDGAGNTDSLTDWDQLVKDLEEGIERYTREGNEEMAQWCRTTLEEAKEQRKQTEAQFRQAMEDARSQDEGLKAPALLEAVRRHAVGQRFFYQATPVYPELMAVVPKRTEDDKNGWGVMDASGRIIIPARYEIIASRDDENGRLPLILCLHEIDRWKDKWEVDIYRQDGSRATNEKFIGANLFSNQVVGVCFPDGSWGLMDGNARILTTRRYKKMDMRSNDLLDAGKGNFIFGERDGVNYILSQTDGSEIGTFKGYEDASGVYHHLVNYYPGKAPAGL